MGNFPLISLVYPYFPGICPVSHYLLHHGTFIGQTKKRAQIARNGPNFNRI